MAEFCNAFIQELKGLQSPGGIVKDRVRLETAARRDWSFVIDSFQFFGCKVVEKNRVTMISRKYCPQDNSSHKRKCGEEPRVYSDS